MIQSLFILNSRGDVIIEKHWRGVAPRTICDQFWEEVSKASTPEETLPVIPTSKGYLVHIQTNGLFLLSLVQAEVAPLLVIDFLYRIVSIFKDYFREVSEDSLKENFVVLYQLLDEMMDNGHPFTTEPNVLKEMIAPTDFVGDLVNEITGAQAVSTQIPDGTMTNIPWRPTRPKYSTNEIYFDIIEEIDCTIDANGMIVNSEITGHIDVSCRLSGMPDMTLTFNNPRIFDDCSFHPCVRYLRFEQSRVISFVPPDGNFELMRYRVSHQIQPPIYCKPQITFGEGGGRVSVMVGAKNTMGKTLENVAVTIPFSKAVASSNLTANIGTVQFNDLTKVCKWTVGKIEKDLVKTPMLQGSVALAPGQGVPEAAPICLVDFKVTMFSASGIRVDSLTLHNENYKPYKGVRTITKAGKFQVRST
eukprot:TRINITY_DN2275_c0_g1_i1.p1 TRINITY_DN2275_c0_g1~~TRINITY_DN2275_c0_g1_i1.p1  ORF type:complete len:418 (+),score=72.55 TRINITY_DN2275_c0_g1_i1:178-1431(+)